MLLAITTTYVPATDLGYLLYKHPERVQNFPLGFGQAHVFYPEATPERCTAVLMLDVDPIGLVRGKSDFALQQYVNDRPYAASSFLSVAIAQIYGTALSGICKDRPELVQTPIPLQATITGIAAHGGEGLLRQLFEPLGYHLTFTHYPLDEQFPEWGMSPYYTITLEKTCVLSDLLSHLYVLIPVLDNNKHYFVDEEEINKLLRHGEGWLAQHPARELITTRYLKYYKHLTRIALERLAESDTVDAVQVEQDQEEAAVEARISLNTQRIGAVLAALKGSGAKRVLDLGCGEGQLLRLLLQEKQFEAILGVDVAYSVLERAAERLNLERLPALMRQRIQLIQGSLIYRDARLAGYDAAAVVEVIEHLDPPRLAAFERVVFEFARPEKVIITTPNQEYNVRWESLPAGKFRHRDHRFEWTRAEFQTWAARIAERFNYSVRFLGIGDADPEVGSPTQMGIFEKTGTLL